MYKLTEVSNYTTDVKFFIFLIADESGPFFVHILNTFCSAGGGIFILKWPKALVIGACNGAPYLMQTKSASIKSTRLRLMDSAAL
jgi:hypothetical protein